MPPGHIWRIRPSGAASAQFWKMVILDSCTGQRFRKGELVELRMPPGSRKTPHIHEELDAI